MAEVPVTQEDISVATGGFLSKAKKVASAGVEKARQAAVEAAFRADDISTLAGDFFRKAKGAANFEWVKRAFGPEEVERAVEDAKRREAEEKEQRKAKWKFSRGAK